MRGGEAEKWGKWRGACGVCRRDLAAGVGVRMSPMSGVCTCPKWSCGIKDCVNLFERDVSFRLQDQDVALFVFAACMERCQVPWCLSTVPWDGY